MTFHDIGQDVSTPNIFIFHNKGRCGPRWMGCQVRKGRLAPTRAEVTACSSFCGKHNDWRVVVKHTASPDKPRIRRGHLHSRYEFHKDRTPSGCLCHVQAVHSSGIFSWTFRTTTSTSDDHRKATLGEENGEKKHLNTNMRVQVCIGFGLEFSSIPSFRQVSVIFVMTVWARSSLQYLVERQGGGEHTIRGFSFSLGRIISG